MDQHKCYVYTCVAKIVYVHVLIYAGGHTALYNNYVNCVYTLKQKPAFGFR